MNFDDLSSIVKEFEGYEIHRNKSNTSIYRIYDGNPNPDRVVYISEEKRYSFNNNSIKAVPDEIIMSVKKYADTRLEDRKTKYFIAYIGVNCERMYVKRKHSNRPLDKTYFETVSYKSSNDIRVNNADATVGYFLFSNDQVDELPAQWHPDNGFTWKEVAR